MNTDPVDGLADGVSDAGLSCVSCETIVKPLWNGHIVDHAPSHGNQGEKNRQQKMDLKRIDHFYVVFLIFKVQNDKTMKLNVRIHEFETIKPLSGVFKNLFCWQEI